MTVKIAIAGWLCMVYVLDQNDSGPRNMFLLCAINKNWLKSKAKHSKDNYVWNLE